VTILDEADQSGVVQSDLLPSSHHLRKPGGIVLVPRHLSPERVYENVDVGQDHEAG